MLFVFNDAATTEIYTLSLHDALPICGTCPRTPCRRIRARCCCRGGTAQRCRCATKSGTQQGDQRNARPRSSRRRPRSEEHTSELQSRQYLVCRLLLAKKRKRAVRHCT